MREPSSARPLVIVAAAALVRDDGRLLLARRPEGKAMAGLWEFPGGKVEAGESPQTALSRELREELSIEVAEDDMEAFTSASHAYERFHLLMPVFLTRRWKGEPTALEGQKLVWASPSDVRNYPTPDADGPLIERYVQWSEAGRV
jgi:8-oxo-dGTP diphosphatase